MSKGTHAHLNYMQVPPQALFVCINMSKIYRNTIMSFKEVRFPVPRRNAR